MQNRKYIVFERERDAEQRIHETCASRRIKIRRWNERVRAKRCDAVDGTLLRNFAYFRLRSGLAMWFCPLDTVAVTELRRLDLFSCFSSSFLCAGTLFPRGRCCYFCGRFSWSRQTSHSKGFPYYFHDSTRKLYFRFTTRQCRCYSKTKTTK